MRHAAAPAGPYQVVRELLRPHFAELGRCRNHAALEALPLYRSLEPLARAALATLDTGDFRPGPAPAKPRYRVGAWNLERGIQLDGQAAALRSHPHLRECDLLLITEADLGMARSGNRDVARELARALGMAYVFAPCYLNLAKGSGVEQESEGENDLGLHGNAILSRYPIRQARAIPLSNGIDKMSRREKRLGRQAAVTAEIELPNGRLTACSVHLDAQSTQRHRRDQMRDVLAALPAGPALLGGDWNTSTYNSSSALRAILGFWLRVMMGVDRVIRHHYLHPDRRFERELFALLERHDFDYRAPNVIGEGTTFYHIADHKARQNLGEWVPWWCFPFIRWALRNHGGRCPLKLDWFAARGLRPAHPAVVHGLELSDHDPITVDLCM